MRLLIYSDVHGNLPAFETMLRDVGICDGYICLGDLVNYGPWSNECVDLALSLPNSIILVGNHERAFLNGVYEGNNMLVKEFFKQTIASFDRFALLKSFLDYYVLAEYICKHTILNKNIYSDTSLDLDNNYIIGHSHHQFHIHQNGLNLYNAGSVGQNREYINLANYLLFDTATHKFEMRYSKFDIHYLLDAMKINNYPANCVLYYKQKLLY